MTCAPFSTAIPDYDFPSTAEEPHCRFVGEGIEKSVADGEDLFARFEGTPILRFKVEREGA